MARRERAASLAFVGLGSNLDEPEQRVRSALEALDRLPRTQRIAHSSLYRNPPYGPVAQPDFVNAVAALRTALAPRALLDGLLALEREQGRRRDGPRWGPRTLDLDLLLYADRILQEPDLVVPHPGLAERAFVLYPLFEIAPELVVPGLGPLAALLAGVDGSLLARIDAAADPDPGAPPGHPR